MDVGISLVRVGAETLRNSSCKRTACLCRYAQHSSRRGSTRSERNGFDSHVEYAEAEQHNEYPCGRNSDLPAGCVQAVLLCRSIQRCV